MSRCLLKSYTLFDTSYGRVDATYKKSVVLGEPFVTFVLKFSKANASGIISKPIVLSIKDNLGGFEPMFTNSHEPIDVTSCSIVKLVKLSMDHLPKNDYLYADCNFGHQ